MLTSLCVFIVLCVMVLKLEDNSMVQFNTSNTHSPIIDQQSTGEGGQGILHCPRTEDEVVKKINC